MTNILEKIESLRSNKTPEEIEAMLLSKELEAIKTGKGGYQSINGITLSWLVMEIHKPGFIDWIIANKYKYVVHHKDRNMVNNNYPNLKVMIWNEHSRIHRIEYCANPANVEAEKARGEAVSTWRKDPKNARTVKAIGEGISKTYRKKWLDLSILKEPFTVKEYAKVGEIGYSTAWLRLSILLREDQITHENKLVDGSWCNIYRRKI